MLMPQPREERVRRSAALRCIRDAFAGFDTGASSVTSVITWLFILKLALCLGVTVSRFWQQDAVHPLA